MRLQNKKGIIFELKIAGYQFPGITGDGWDSNWLIVTGHGIHPKGDWRFSDPCLTTSELEQLAAFLEHIDTGGSSDAACDFIEPNLAFRLVKSPEPSLEVRFALESAPPWAAGKTRCDGIALSFPLAENDLKESAASLRSYLRRFPKK